MNDRFVIKRYLNIALIFFWTVAGTVLLSVFHGRYMDEILIYLVSALVFAALLWFVLEYSRTHRRIASNRETTFGGILRGYLLCWLLLLPASFLPEFVKPVLMVPLVMLAFSTPLIALYVSMFLNALLCLVCESSIFEMVLYAFLILCGCMLADAIEERRLRLWYELVLFAVSAMLPSLFAYMSYRETRLSVFLYSVLEGGVIVLLLHLFYPEAAAEREAEIPHMLEDMLDASYPLNRELKKFSKADYAHAKRVSRVAARCAGLVGADEKLCAAAGFYYRIGILEGGAIGAGGVRLAQRECFPEDVIRIIHEYNGEEALPSDIASAIVHMVDGLIKKLELFDTDMLASDWNQNMVIYQTLNDFSAQGLYDQSGLTMNMFLKIREYLANEEALL